jgi:hypothetical protein
MKNAAQIINSLDIATKEYADGKVPSTTNNNILNSSLKSQVNESWSVNVFIADETNANVERAIYKKGAQYWTIFQVGAVYLTTDINFDPNKQFFYYGYDILGNPWVNDNWTQLEDVITLKQKNDTTKEVTIYAWQRTS